MNRPLVNTLVAFLVCAPALRSAAEAAAQLPNPFLFRNGAAVQTREDWDRRRAELLEDLLSIEYGHAPEVPSVTVKSEQREQREDIYLEQAARWATKVTVTLDLGGVPLQAGYWKPRDAAAALPAILAIEPVWWPDPFVVNHVVDRVLSRNFVLAGFWVNDLASFEDPKIRPAQDAYPGHDWGVAAVGAWGFSATMNWLATLEAVNAKQVAIWGHSRGGKACILAGALDKRFAAVIPHMSGMGGSAVYRVRGKGAQELEGLLERYWLHPNIFEYIDREEALPFDQHWLHALIAPRALYLHVGKEDAWGDPPGEQAAWQAAREVYTFLGAREKLGIYFGDYGHYGPNWAEGGDSWETALQFLEWQFRGKAPEKSFTTPLDQATPPFSWRAP